MVDELVLVLPHFEKIIMLAELLDRAFAVRTNAVGHVFFCPEPLIERAIPARVVGFINQLLIEQLLKVSLDDVLMLSVGRSDKRIVGDV